MVSPGSEEVLAGPLWTREIFLEGVPPALRSDPDVLALAEQFRIETEHNLRVQRQLKTRILALKQALAQKKMTNQS